LAQSGHKRGVAGRVFRWGIRSNSLVAANKVVHNGGHKTKAGLLTKPYFIGFLGFPEPADESPSFSASCLTEAKNPAK
jgi:hypothetical protein